MKKISLVLFALLFVLSSCSKYKIDASNQLSFRKSINKLTSGLDTRNQVKFTEALYIIKTFGTEEESYPKQMAFMREILADKTVEQVFQIADQIAQKEGIDWSSESPPSLGEMNVFEEIVATEVDPNEINADDEIFIRIKPTAYDSIKGPQAVRIIPKLVNNDQPIYFTKATLPVTLEIQSGGKQLLKRKNLMVDNDFKGFYLSYDKLPYNLLEDGLMDVIITIKTSKKIYKTVKRGVRVNTRVFSESGDLKSFSYDEIPVEELPDNKSVKDEEDDDTVNASKEDSKPKVSPEKTVQSFLSNLNAKNLKEAYKVSSNPSWGSYDNFANTNSGFGSVNKLNVKSLKTNSVNNNTASVDAVYDVEDKTGGKTSLNVTFGLKKVDGVWKIASYTIK